ncbi:MAG: SMI1/KNR4 family protein [Planctomycetales bacterium]|nr:SMI1/KNR4 family protein [Planctomycetales bacterium]MBN8628812.1 SMI1/KNR4 family protein [Planctomycetota bacterium]
MTEADIRLIENRLGLTLPQDYRDRLLAGVRINGHLPEPYFVQDRDDLLVDNVHVRDWMGAIFDDKPWPRNLFCIGNDGCGDYYAISTDDVRCSVIFWDHETGELTEDAANLDEYFARIDKLCRFSSTEPPAEVEADEPSDTRRNPFGGPDMAVLTRADKPRFSALDPISLAEWEAFVKADGELQLKNFKTAKNPFTGEERRIEQPGQATLTTGSTVDEFRYGWGDVKIDRPSRKAIEKLKTAAARLGAKLWTNFELT